VLTASAAMRAAAAVTELVESLSGTTGYACMCGPPWVQLGTASAWGTVYSVDTTSVRRTG